MGARDNDAALRARMATLLRTPVPVLRKRLAGLGKDPAGLSKDELVKALAAPAPEPAPAAKAPAQARATATRATRVRARDPRLPAPGTIIGRVYKGQTHEVEVLERGFRYDGKEWRSLTAVALAITGYKAISGTLFFGVAKRAGKEPA